MDGDPQWTKGGNWTLGQDPLGLQATSARIYQSLVPGVTNVTNRLRYYAYYPWLAKLYEQRHHADGPKRWAKFVRRGEALFALATVVADTAGSDGLGGSIWAFNHRQRAVERGIELARYTDDPNSSETYFQQARGNYGAAYGPTLVGLGWLSKTPIPVAQQRGEEVAEVFEQSIGDIAGPLADVIDSGIASPEQLRLIGEAVHPLAIEAGSAELRLLRDFLLGEWEDDVQSAARRSTIWLTLDLYQRGISVGDQAGLRTTFYTRRLTDGLAYDPPGRSVDHWRAYQANEYCHVALECALNALVGLQRDEFKKGIEPRRLIGELLTRLSLPASNWSDWSEGLLVETDWAEPSLAQTVATSIQSGQRPADAVTMDAFRLLALLWARWRSGEGDVREIVGLAAGPGGRSLDGVLRTLDGEGDISVSEALAAVLFKHIIIDHQTIAGRKLPGTFTYHFLIEDGLLSEGMLGAYDYTTPRLGNLTRLLRDAQLLDADGVTADGKAFLEQNQPL